MAFSSPLRSVFSSMLFYWFQILVNGNHSKLFFTCPPLCLPISTTQRIETKRHRVCLEVPEEVVPKNEDDEDDEDEEQQYGKRPRLSLIPPRSLLHDGKKNKGNGGESNRRLKMSYCWKQLVKWILQWRMNWHELQFYVLLTLQHIPLTLFQVPQSWLWHRPSWRYWILFTEAWLMLKQAARHTTPRLAPLQYPRSPVPETDTCLSRLRQLGWTM